MKYIIFVNDYQVSTFYGDDALQDAIDEADEIKQGRVEVCKCETIWEKKHPTA